jgi:hypothetical protein
MNGCAQLYRDQSPTNYGVQLGWSDYIYPLTVVSLALWKYESQIEIIIILWVKFIYLFLKKIWSWRAGARARAHVGPPMPFELFYNYFVFFFFFFLYKKRKKLFLHSIQNARTKGVKGRLFFSTKQKTRINIS